MLRLTLGAVRPVATLRELIVNAGLKMDDIERGRRTLPRQSSSGLSRHELEIPSSHGVDPDVASRMPLVAGVLRRQQLDHASPN